MSFISINTNSPMSRELAQSRALAKEAKTNVLGKVGQFQKLDEVEGVDLASNRKDEVSVNSSSSAVLPKTIQEQLAQKLKGAEAKEPLVTASGFSRADDKGLASADVVVTTDGKSSDYLYERLEDGTEVYLGPTTGGYAVVRENAQNGTLFMQFSEEPDVRSFNAATRSSFEGPAASNDVASNTPTTINDSLKQLAEARHTSNGGTYVEGVKQRTEMVKSALGALGSWFGGKAAG